MTDISRSLREQVVTRAQNRCEYCGLSQLGQEATFHIDHVQPVFAGGLTVIDNLALACVSCSLRKGARTHVLEPTTGEIVPVFSPRDDIWSNHFEWQGAEVVARTDIGRAMISALDLNRPLIRAIRSEEAALGRHPPPSK